jgi:hypothetical protein
MLIIMVTVLEPGNFFAIRINVMGLVGMQELIYISLPGWAPARPRSPAEALPAGPSWRPRAHLSLSLSLSPSLSLPLTTINVEHNSFLSNLFTYEIFIFFPKFLRVHCGPTKINF